MGHRLTRKEIVRAVSAYHCLKKPSVELPALFSAFARTGARSFLEIGTFKGATSAAMALAFPKAAITTIDLPDTEAATTNPQPSEWCGMALLALGLDKSVRQVRMHSERLIDWVEAGMRFDMIFVDGDHDRRAVERDLELAFGLLEPNGCVVAHDYTDVTDADQPWWTKDVRRAVETFMERRPTIVKQRLGGKDAWLVELRQP